MAPRVAVVGGGPLGLMAVKILIEDGFEVTGFEKRAYIGGLWKPAPDAQTSVVPGTVFNSSRYRSAVSDFPFPPDTNDFPTNKQLFNYLNAYADHFNLRQHFKLNAEVKDLLREENRWGLTVSYDNSTNSQIEYFDKILVASGSFTTPRQPHLKGSEGFQGQILHSLEFNSKEPTEFDGQKGLLIGLHATAQDITCELAGHAKKVYISHRSGVLLLPRYMDDRPFDLSMGLKGFFVQSFLSGLVPSFWDWLVDAVLLKASKKAFPAQKKEWNLLPAPSIAVTTPLIADAVWPHLESGFAEPCVAVEEIIGPDTVKLRDGKVLTGIDFIINCTGYDFAVPFLPQEFNPYSVPGQPPNLYRYIFSMHPDPAVRNSLAFAGQSAVAFPGFIQMELQIMAISQTWLGRSTLPSLAAMQKWHADIQQWRRSLQQKQKKKSTFYSIFLPVSHIKWLDETAGTGIFENLGWFKWRAWKLWWQDKALYEKCTSGIMTPTMFRLFDCGRRKVWPQARQQIFVDNEIADRAYKERLDLKQAEAEKKTK